MTIKDLFIFCLKEVIKGNEDLEVIIYYRSDNWYVDATEIEISKHYNSRKEGLLMMEIS